jgi:DNA-binding beta-propeller fold protein YncE
VFGPEGHLYVAAAAQPSVGPVQVRDAESGALLRDFGSSVGLSNATGLAFDIHGSLWVADYAGNRLVIFDARSGERTGMVEASDLSHPVSIQASPDGWLYVVDDHGVSRIHPDSEPALELVISAEQAQLERPRSLTFVYPNAAR